MLSQSCHRCTLISSTQFSAQRTFRLGLLLAAFACVGKSPLYAVDISTGMLDRYVERILEESGDAKLRAHAREYQNLAGRRKWREQNPVDTNTYFFYATFDRMVTSPGGLQAVKFREYQDPYLLNRLTEESRDDIRLLLKYRQEFAAHFNDGGGVTANSGISSGGAIGGLSGSPNSSKNTQVGVLKVDTLVELDGVEITLKAGERFPVLNTTIDSIELVVASSAVTVPKSRVDVRTVPKSNVSAKPIIIDELGIAGLYRADGESLKFAVMSVDPGRPAAALRSGDLILKVSGKTITNPSQFQANLAEQTQFSLTIKRGGSLLRIPIDTRNDENVSNDSDSANSEPRPWPELGFVGISTDNGEFRITYIIEGPSIAKTAGLRSGDIILLVNDSRVRDLEDIQQQFKGGEYEATLIVVKKGDKEARKIRVKR